MSISGSSQGTNSAFEGGGPPEAWAGGPTPPGLYIYVYRSIYAYIAVWRYAPCAGRRVHRRVAPCGAVRRGAPCAGRRVHRRAAPCDTVGAV